MLEAGVMYLASLIETRDLEVSSSETLTPIKASLKAGILRNCLLRRSSRAPDRYKRNKKAVKRIHILP